ncbi:MAG: hypothetical protein WAL30_00060 [Candidatus Aquirickettsiella sp.]
MSEANSNNNDIPKINADAMQLSAKPPSEQDIENNPEKNVRGRGDILKKTLGENHKVMKIWAKYRAPAKPSIDITLEESLLLSIKHLELQLLALHPENSGNKELIDEVLKKINKLKEIIKNTKELDPLTKSFDALETSIEKIQCKKLVNKNIIKNIKLVLVSCRYIDKKIHPNDARQMQYRQEKLRKDLRKFIADITPCKSISTQNLLLRANSLFNRIREYNAYFELTQNEKNSFDENLEQIKNSKSKVLEQLNKSNGSAFLKFSKIYRFHFKLEYLISRMKKLNYVDSSNKKDEPLSAYTLALPLNELLIRNITILDNALLNESIITQAEKEFIDELNNAACISYDPIFTNPPMYLENQQLKTSCGPFLTQLQGTVEELLEKAYFIQDRSTREKCLDAVNEMIQIIRVTNEHSTYFYNKIDNEIDNENPKCYTEKQYDMLKTTILTTYNEITISFPAYNFDVLKSKIEAVLKLTPQTNAEQRKASYIAMLIYFGNVLKLLKEKQSLNSTVVIVSFLLGLDKNLRELNIEKIALQTSSIPKPDKPKLEPKKHEENSAQNFLLPKDLVKRLKNSFELTLNRLNNDIQNVRGLPPHVKNQLSIKYQENYNKKTEILIEEIKKKQNIIEKLLCTPLYFNVNKLCYLKLQCLFIKLDLLQSQHKICEALSQHKNPNNVLDPTRLTFYNENVFDGISNLKKSFKNNLEALNVLLILENEILNFLLPSSTDKFFNLELSKTKLATLNKILIKFLTHTDQLKGKNKKTVEDQINVLKDFFTSIEISTIDRLNKIYASEQQALPLKRYECSEHLNKISASEQQALPLKRYECLEHLDKIYASEQQVPPLPLPPKMRDKAPLLPAKLSSASSGKSPGLFQRRISPPPSQKHCSTLTRG